VEQNLWLLALIPILKALHLLWFWTSYYVLLASELDLEKIGREMGALEVLSKIATLIGPLVGVLLISFISFKGVFWIGALFYFLAILALLMLPKLQIRTQWNWSDFRDAFSSSAGRKQLVGLGGSIWENIAIIAFWPLFLYIFFQENIVAVGYILTGATFISFVFIYLSGWIFDHRKRKSSWELGSGGTLAILWLLRGLAFQFPLFTVFTELVDKIVGGVYYTLFTSLVVLRIRANNSIIYAYNRQIAFALAQIVGSASLYLVLFLNVHLAWMFVSFFVGGMLGLLFVKDRRLRYRLDK
jgi:MFS family permease